MQIQYRVQRWYDCSTNPNSAQENIITATICWYGSWNRRSINIAIGMKYCIEYIDGTIAIAALTKTALKKVLLPPLVKPFATDAPSVTRGAVGEDGVPTATESDTEAPPEEGTAVATEPHAAAAALDEAAATDGTVSKAAVQHQRTN